MSAITEQLTGFIEGVPPRIHARSKIHEQRSHLVDRVRTDAYISAEGNVEQATSNRQ
jgi:hypothetical protein